MKQWALPVKIQQEEDTVRGQQNILQVRAEIDNAWQGPSGFGWHKLLLSIIIIYFGFSCHQHEHLWNFLIPVRHFSLFSWSRNVKPSNPQENGSFPFLSQTLCRRWSSRGIWRVWWRNKMFILMEFPGWQGRSLGTYPDFLWEAAFTSLLTLSVLYFSAFYSFQHPMGNSEPTESAKRQEWISSGNVGWGAGENLLPYPSRNALVTSLSPAGSSRRWKMSLVQVWSLKLWG